jgi:hypothetical protein
MLFSAVDFDTVMDACESKASFFKVSGATLSTFSVYKPF